MAHRARADALWTRRRVLLPRSTTVGVASPPDLVGPRGARRRPRPLRPALRPQHRIRVEDSRPEALLLDQDRWNRGGGCLLRRRDRSRVRAAWQRVPVPSGPEVARGAPVHVPVEPSGVGDGRLRARDHALWRIVGDGDGGRLGWQRRPQLRSYHGPAQRVQRPLRDLRGNVSERSLWWGVELLHQRLLRFGI